MNTLLAHLYRPQWWLAGGRTVRVTLPVKRHTKRELVSRYLASGADPGRLDTDTFSCYHPRPDNTACGACKPCARKWVALRANGLPVSFDAADYVDDIYGEPIRAGQWDRGEREAADVMDALACV